MFFAKVGPCFGFILPLPLPPEEGTDLPSPVSGTQILVQVFSNVHQQTTAFLSPQPLSPQASVAAFLDALGLKKSTEISPIEYFPRKKPPFDSRARGADRSFPSWRRLPFMSVVPLDLFPLAPSRFPFLFLFLDPFYLRLATPPNSLENFVTFKGPSSADSLWLSSRRRLPPFFPHLLFPFGPQLRPLGLFR